ncbi:hypothetical protein F443_05776 [Phytophthora nicotianae P1569]|uniref:DUF6818 domain-containing protein n=1 Tax=Phytophthora nicotianae P1569 TaxID=1317065 RepID=V9FJZ5_PHYNI|nr:hypothetical protein F443_05776 [Phytophthora nicotianae P1569]
MPRRGGRASGSEGYSITDIDKVVDCVRSVKPIGANEWEEVLEQYQQYAAANGRAVRNLISIKKKFQSLINAKEPTGDIRTALNMCAMLVKSRISMQRKQSMTTILTIAVVEHRNQQMTARMIRHSPTGVLSSRMGHRTMMEVEELVSPTTTGRAIKPATSQDVCHNAAGGAPRPRSRTR